MLQSQEARTENGEVIARRVRVGFLKLIVEVERREGENGVGEQARGPFSTPARQERRGADGGKEGVDVVHDDIARGGRGVEAMMMVMMVVIGETMAVRRCCCCRC